MKGQDSQLSFSASKHPRQQIFTDNQPSNLISHQGKPVFSKNYTTPLAEQHQSRGEHQPRGEHQSRVEHQPRGEHQSRGDSLNDQSQRQATLQNRLSTFNPDIGSIQCRYHVDQVITLICLHPACIMPLCPQCVKIHSMEHQQQGTYGQFETLESCLKEAYNKLNLYSKRFAEEVVTIQHFQGTTGDGLQEQVARLNKAKQQAYTIIDQFFQTLEQELVEEIQKNHEFLAEQSTNFLKYLTQRQNQLNNFAEKMKTEKCLKNLLKYYCQNVEEDNELYFRESQHFVTQLSKFAPHVIIDQPGMYQLSIDLARFVSLKKGMSLGPQRKDSRKIETEWTQERNKYAVNPYENPAQTTQNYPPQQVREKQGPAAQENKPPKETDELHPYLRTPPKNVGIRSNNPYNSQPSRY